ncbi:MAG: TetR/AcrR family transcriptional regulator [Actinobacteria bacterium]|nr:TetR/AcrR family transcriptional regulator [Actinomycetota bacterium]
MVVVGERKSKEERREEILDAAMEVFAQAGYHGASTEEIARRAGISQPYVFRLFGTKKELFMAVDARCFRQTLEIFQRAAEGLRGEEALNAIGLAYGELLATDRTYLRAQMQAYAACDDPEICAVVRNGFGDLVTYVERVSGCDQATVARFFAKGMLMNVLSSLDLKDANAGEPWAQRLLAGCNE